VNRAYHINDDRYDHMELDPRFEKLKKGISWKQGISNRVLEADAFDANAWLVAIRQGLASAPSAKSASRVRASKSMGSILLGDDSVPPMTTSNSAGFLNGMEAIVSPAKDESEKQPNCFALVGTNRKGNVIIQWLNPMYKNKYINVGGVMNQAAVVVTEFCPGKFICSSFPIACICIFITQIAPCRFYSEQSAFPLYEPWSAPFDCTWWRDWWTSGRFDHSDQSGARIH